MDNARIHHGGRIQELCDAAGVRLIYLPPYSPDYNPIEIAFNVVKGNFRRTQIIQCTLPEDKIDVIEEVAIEIITPRLMHSLYQAGGYWV